jgi:hypothetical protein
VFILPPVATNPPPVVTNSLPRLTNSPPVTNLLAALNPVPGTDSLPLYATSFYTNFVLVYPAWASNFAVEFSPGPAPGSWTPVTVTSNIMGNYLVVPLPLTSSNGFFRLRL